MPKIPFSIFNRYFKGELMHAQKVGSPRSTDASMRLPDHGAAPLSPRTSTPRVLQKEYDALLLSLGKRDSLCETVFDIGSFINTMRPAIAKECARAGLPARAERMHETAAQISNALGQVETFYEKDDFANCQTYLTAAKGNQVSLLAAIDALKQDPDGDQEFSEAHDQCAQLGHKIAALLRLVIEKSNQRQYPQQQQQQRPASPRPSSPRFVSSPERQKNQKARRTDAASSQSDKAGYAPRSPERESDSGRPEKLPASSPGKRAHGDEDSPRMKNSAAKRQKTQAATPVASMPAQGGSGATNQSLRQGDALSHSRPIGPSSPSKAPGLDWSSAKPVNTAPHSPLSTTPRTARQARTEPKGTAKQGADAAFSLPSAPESDAGTGADGNGHSSSMPASAPPARSLASPDSPRKALPSATKPLKAQPRPRPPSMLFTSPPVPFHQADPTERTAKKTRDTDIDIAAPQIPQSLPASLGIAEAADSTAVAQGARDAADS